MKEPWIVFYHQEKEIAAYTVCGTFQGERQATIDLLAAERGIDPADITTKIEERKAKR